MSVVFSPECKFYQTSVLSKRVYAVYFHAGIYTYDEISQFVQCGQVALRKILLSNYYCKRAFSLRPCFPHGFLPMIKKEKTTLTE